MAQWSRSNRQIFHLPDQLCVGQKAGTLQSLKAQIVEEAGVGVTLSKNVHRTVNGGRKAMYLQLLVLSFPIILGLGQFQSDAFWRSLG